MNVKFRFGKRNVFLIVWFLFFAVEMVVADTSGEVDPSVEKLEGKELEITEEMPTASEEAEEEGSEELDDETDSGDDVKRHIGSLARFNKYPWSYRTNAKRFIGSIAAKGYLPSGKRYLGSVAANDGLPDKKFIGSLAANGNLPGKRHIASLAAKGYLPGKRFIGSLAQNGNLPDKKFLGSLAANDNLPGKRFIGSLASNGNLPGKRFIGSLASNGNLPGKRFIGSLASNGNLPGKRFLGSLAANGNLPGKRYLASLVSKGNLRPLYRRDDSSFDDGPDEDTLLEQEPIDWGFSDNNYESQRFKRHIGAIARSNGFPSIYSFRRGRRSDDTPYALPQLSESTYNEDEGDVEKRFLGSLDQ